MHRKTDVQTFTHRHAKRLMLFHKAARFIVRQYIYPMRMCIVNPEMADMVIHFSIMQTKTDWSLNFYAMFMKKRPGLFQAVTNQGIVTMQAGYFVDRNHETVVFNSGTGLPVTAEQYRHEYVLNKAHEQLIRFVCTQYRYLQV